MLSRIILQRAALLTLTLSTGRLHSVTPQSEPLVDIRGLTPQELRSAAFVLPAPQALHIEASGAEPRVNRDGSWWGDEDERNTWPAAAWILDARTREVVWDLRTARTERAANGVRHFTGSVQLPAGVYEAYFGSFVATSVSYRGSFREFISQQRERNRDHVTYGGPYVDDGSYRQFGLEIRGAGRRATDRDVDSATRAFTASAVLSLRPGGPGASERSTFELPRAMDVAVYAIGELRRDGAFDYGWLLNADTHRRVWEMAYAHTSDGGGAHKNRMVRTTLHLPAGRYVAYYVSDDSHDPEDWNAVPPYDPAFWGLTLRIADPTARAGVRPFAWSPVPEGQMIVALTKIGDDELRSRGFTLRRPMDVRIYALGEGSDPDGEMDDYAWILDVTTHTRVWAMRYPDTEPAGGADKNRLFDGTIHLDPGSYLVYYRSDGSHSYGHWNAAPPAERRYWGVSVFPANGQLEPAAVAPFEAGGRGGSAIAELVRMRDGERSHVAFSLDRATRVRVYALGEGMEGELVDYGWIEDARTGNTVWKMTYDATSDAGGARKNRLFDGTIRLPAGRYELHYETDGSHAFGDWNADPPDDPDAWGITLLPADVI